ncbi:MAG: membrane dipeptidase [Pyrinomonadaceae bacterium]
MMKKSFFVFRSILGFCLLLSLTSAQYLAQTRVAQAAPPANRDPQLWRQALRIHRASVVIDGHNDVTTPMVDENYDLGTPSAGKYHTDIRRMKQGGVTGQFFAIYVGGDYVKSGGSARRALDMIDMVYRAAERHPRDFTMATTAADILRAKRTGKIAALMGIEGGHAIENSLMALRDFYRLGVRYMTLTHNNTNDWADASRDARGTAASQISAKRWCGR